MSYVELKSIVKSYDDTQVIHNVDLTLEKEEFSVFVGPSGCGKSTLLRMIAGLEELNAGSIHIDGKRVDELAPSKRGIAMVFQNYALYPHMSIYQNMSFGLRLAKEGKEEIDRRVREAAEILQITQILDRKPKALSGGQRQRVAIGRAIVREPRVFLFDEPLSNLDAKLRVQMRVELTRLHKRLKSTAIYVTHDQVEAMTMADKIVVLRNGRIEQAGRPMVLYYRPNSKFVAGFIGSPAMNFLEGKITDLSDNWVNVELEGGYHARVACKPDASTKILAPVTLGVRPEALKLELKGGAEIPGKVFAAERLGIETYLYVHTADGQEITVHAPGDHPTTNGHELTLSFFANDCHLFSADGKAFERSDA